MVHGVHVGSVNVARFASTNWRLNVDVRKHAPWVQLGREYFRIVLFLY